MPASSADALRLYREILAVYHVRCHYVRPPYTDLCGVDYGLRAHLYPDYSYTHLVRNISERLQEDTVCYFQDIFSFGYFFFPYPEPDGTPAFLLVGPFTYTPVTAARIAHVAQIQNIPQEFMPDLTSALRRMPMIYGKIKWLEMNLTYISHLLTGGDRNRLHYIDLNRQPYERYGKPWISDTHNLEQAGGLSSDSLDALSQHEAQMLRSVQKGDIAGAVAYAHKYINFYLNFNHILPHGAEYSVYLHQLNTLLRRSVLDASVHTVYVLPLYDYYEKHIRKLSGCEDTPPFYQEIIEGYCDLVKKHSHANYSALIRQALTYIEMHYTEDISLRHIAEALSINPVHLSATFKKEYGRTVTEYLTAHRIQHAKLLLEYSDDSIIQIALQCGYADPSYFTKVFKRQTGVSPKQYCKQHHHEKF